MQRGPGQREDRRGRGGPGAGPRRGWTHSIGPSEAFADALTERGSRRQGRAGGRVAASMVLVLHHILIAVVQFLRRGQQVFLKPDEPPPPPPQPCADSLQVGGPPSRASEIWGGYWDKGVPTQWAPLRSVHSPALSPSPVLRVSHWGPLL